MKMMLTMSLPMCRLRSTCCLLSFEYGSKVEI